MKIFYDARQCGFVRFAHSMTLYVRRMSGGSVELPTMLLCMIVIDSL